MADNQHTPVTSEIQGIPTSSAKPYAPGQEFDLIHAAHGRLMTTSLLVAERFGKRHDNVLRDIERFLASPEPETQAFCLLNFEEASHEVSQPNGGTAKYPMYEMTKDGFIFLVMGFTGREAELWKIRFIAAFNAMNTALREREPWRYEPLPGRTKRSPQQVSFCDILNALPTLGGEIYREDLYYSLRLLIEQLRRGQYREKARMERRLRTLERLTKGESHE